MVRWVRLLRRSLVVLLVALGVAGSEAPGQTSAAIAGRVTDTEGAPLAERLRSSRWRPASRRRFSRAPTAATTCPTSTWAGPTR